ncbi:MAG TPA: RHS repeat-associated core domain-containing protein [Candidatus Angelobacter sp.]|nr:RHS repeat-associated core domain-containing protein [Candidatus Angelobacter sp.]
MKLVKAIVSFCAAIGLSTALALGQTAPNLENGFKSFGSYGGSNIDTVNLENGGVMLHISSFSYPQRGSYGLAYTFRLASKNWQVGSYYDSTHTYRQRWMLAGQPGLTLNSSYDVQLKRVRTTTTDVNGGVSYADFNYGVRTPDGSVHWLAGILPNGNMVTQDGSNFQFTLTRGSMVDGSNDSGVLRDGNGTTYSYAYLSYSRDYVSALSGTSANVVAHVEGWRNTLMAEGNNTVQTFNDTAGPTSIMDANGNTMGFGISVSPSRVIAVGPALDTSGRPIPFDPGSAQGTVAAQDNCVALTTISSAYLFNFPGPDGRVSPVLVCYAQLTLAPTFSQANVEPPHNDTYFKSYPPGSNNASVASLVMPDGAKWAFNYDAYGNITTINLPTGGQITYTWKEITAPPSCEQDDTAVSRAVATRTVNDLINPPQTWQYTWGTLQPDNTITNYVLDPDGNETAHVFQSPVLPLQCSLYEIETRTYQGTHDSGTLLKTVDTHYTATTNYNNASSFVVKAVADTITTTLPGNKVSKIVRQYDGYPSFSTFQKITDEKVYDYSGALLKDTTTTYLWQSNPAYLNAGLLDLPASVIVTDGSGCKMSETDYAYDEPAYANINYETTVGALPAGTHQAVAMPRGNLTSTTHKLFDHSQCTPATQSAVSSHTVWYDTGEPYQQIDPLGHKTTYSYDPVYAGVYATQTCSPQTGAVTHCVSGTYDSLTGLLESLTNENATAQASGNTPGDSAHTANYSYDTSWRLIQAQAPSDPANGNARATTTFTPSAPNAFPLSVQRQHSVTTSLTDTSTAYFDGVDRVNETTHALPNGTATVVTTYDGLGQTASVTNPYFNTSDPTYGVTQTQYDGLGRPTQTTKQDGSISSIQYDQSASGSTGTCTVTQDEAGAQRRTCSDALGRLIEVDEPGGSFAGTQATGSVTVSGTLASQNGVGQTAATQAHGSVVMTSSTSSGGDFSMPDPNAPLCQPPHPCQVIWDSGTAQITVNGASYVARYSQTVTLPALASSLVNAINAGGVLSASASAMSCTVSCSITLSFTAPAGTAGNTLPVSASSTSNDPTDFGGATYSFNSSTVAMSGGSDANPGVTVWDQGNVTIMVDGYSISVPYGQSTSNSASTLATSLASGLNVSASPVTASASGTTLTLNYKNMGGNGTISISSTSTQTQWSFPANAFTGTGAMANGEAASGPGLVHNYYVTLYQYDGLGNLTCVEQHGGVTGTGCSSPPANDATSPWRVRRFSYDSLGRLLSAKNPESGTISYVYDNDGHLLQKTSPAPNQTNPAVTQTASYCYDELNRVTGRAYGALSCPLTSPVVSYAYDAGANGNGHLTSLTDQAGTGSYSYDVLGRLSSETRVISGVSKSMSYEYNLDGSLYKLHYPSGAVVTYTPDSAGRMLSAVDSGNGINYVTGATYGPDGSLMGLVNGSVITNAFTYNKRLQPVNMSAATSSATVFSIGYDFHLGNGDNGNVYGITNYKDTARNQTFTYDPLNRLLSAQNAGTNCAATTANGKTEYWGNSYTYDAWGNLLQKSVTKCSAENAIFTATVTNQFLYYSYDAAGNMLNDGVFAYNFDPENRVTGAAGYAYTYDADGERVKKSNGTTGTLYWYMTPGIVAETDLSGNNPHEYVFFNGERIARKDSNRLVYYYFSDHLKTASVVTDSAGGIRAESDYYPWGGELQFTTNDSNHYKFTGKERDGETGLDYFGARYYSNALGRFMTPDWAAKATAVPYADFGSPQSLNLYSYTKNNPTTFGDADGHCPDGICYNIAAKTPAQIDHLAQVTPQVTIGAGKTLVNAVTSTANIGVNVATHGGMYIPGTTPEIPQLQPKNEAQAAGMTSMNGALATTGVVTGGVAIVDLTATVRAASVIDTTTVIHFTSDAGVAGITDSGGLLRSGTYVTTPGEIPANATSTQVENLLEIGPGKGQNSVTFETPTSNLTVPENGPTTSGGAQQFQLKQPTQIDPTKFKQTGGGS